MPLRPGPKTKGRLKLRIMHYFVRYFKATNHSACVNGITVIFSHIYTGAKGNRRKRFKKFPGSSKACVGRKSPAKPLAKKIGMDKKPHTLYQTIGRRSQGHLRSLGSHSPPVADPDPQIHGILHRLTSLHSVNGALHSGRHGTSGPMCNSYRW